MNTSTANVKTEHASRYMKQLCKHWSHKFEVVYDDENGRVPFSPDAEVTFAVQDGALERLQAVVADHLKRFAFREDLDITWSVTIS